MRPVTPNPIKTKQGRRVAAQKRGLRAESAAVWLLRLKGYRILLRNYRVPVGEIDILARRGSHLVAVEVKARNDASAAAASIQIRQRRRVARALEHFLASRPDLRTLAIRFDVVLVAPGKWPRHLPGAWIMD